MYTYTFILYDTWDDIVFMIIYSKKMKNDQCVNRNSIQINLNVFRYLCVQDFSTYCKL